MFKLSIALNVILLLAGIFFMVKRYNFVATHQRDYHHFTDNPQYQEYLPLQSAYKKKGRIVFFGCSFTSHFRWNEFLNRSDIVERGIGDDVTLGYLSRLQTVFDAGPEIVFVEGGVNDIEYNCPLDSTVVNFKKIFDTLQKKNIKVIYTNAFPAASIYTPNNNPGIAALNHKMDSLCRAQNVPLIDINSQITDEKGYLKYYQAGGLHLGIEAYRIWAKEIEKYLK